jgi:hypothetical protein
MGHHHHVVVITMLNGQSYGFPTLNATTCQTGARERIVEKFQGNRISVSGTFNADRIKTVQEKDGDNKKPDLSV